MARKPRKTSRSSEARAWLYAISALIGAVAAALGAVGVGG